MATAEPIKVDFDSRVLDSIASILENVLEGYEQDTISAESALGAVRDIVTVINRLPRSVTVDVGGSDGL